ncbi:hypothetical protein JHK84_032054 [Glycine max]|nr:hypothetical protein JHK84_032054 [Glycine max]
MFDNLNRILHLDWLNSIAEIDDQKETWKIVVRVINMWIIPRSPKFIVELNLVHKKGDKFLTQMKNVDVQLDNVIFYVGQTYVIHNFEVEKNNGHYKATRHGFKINFVKATKVTPHKILEILETMYNFTMFDDIVSGSTNIDFSIDVIGEVVEIVQWNLHGKPKKVVFTMKDGWFRMDVIVGQPHESAIFTLWDRECYALIKETAAEIKQKMIDKQCFSATTESDPTLLGSITLAKHILPLSHSQLDEISFEDLSSIQLSLTRLDKKHIKTE